jgi:signal transduction histidine kinase
LQQAKKTVTCTIVSQYNRSFVATSSTSALDSNTNASLPWYDSVWVSDDGVGFSQTTQANPGAYGLFGMAERAAHCGGHLDIDSVPGAETTLTMYLPVPCEPVAGSEASEVASV